jgi:phosphatidylglycerol:prolipoprotein diacylglycerol transferase
MNFPATTPTPTPGYWEHNLDPFLLHFPKGWPLDGLRWYGLAYVAAFAIAWFLLRLYYKRGKSPLNEDQQGTLLVAAILGVLVGGRLGYVFGYMLVREPELVFQNPLVIFQVNNGGMASHGGMIGVWLALAWFAWKTKSRFWRVLDIVVTLAPAGFFLGRIANFINGELWGRVTDVPWAVVFSTHDRWGSIAYLEPRHPSQLYAAVLEGLLMLAWTQWRFWKFKLPEGQLVGETMFAYAVVRIVGEFFREPDEGVGLILGLSRGQFYSVFLGLLGIAVIVWARRRRAPVAS